jgi:hypothetical protein
MNPLVNRNNSAADVGHVQPADAPMQVPPLSEEAAHTLGAEAVDARYKGDLFLPGWLPIERDPSAEQGPG